MSPCVSYIFRAEPKIQWKCSRRGPTLGLGRNTRSDYIRRAFWTINMKKKLKAVWAWLRKNIFNKDCLLGAIIAEAIFWSPCIITGLLAVIYSPWWWSAFSGIILFWCGPFTPAVPLQLALIVAVNKILKKIKIKKKEINSNE